jgi:hypothetical protein
LFKAAVISIGCSHSVLSTPGTAVRRQTKSGWRVPPFILDSLLFQHVKNREFLTELTIVNSRNILGAVAAVV